MLDLLEGQTVDGTPALEVLVRTWCENAETFQGFWPPRVSTLALCACFASARTSLQNVIIKGDIIVKPETKNGECPPLRLSRRPPGAHDLSRVSCSVGVGGLVIMTRSRTKKSARWVTLV